MSVRGGHKGSAFERKISVALSLWVSHGKRRDLFWRSSMSGGRATVFKKRGVDLKHQAGDIVAVADEGFCLTKTYFIEVKHYKNLQIDRFLLESKGILDRFWKKANHQALSHKLQPILIAKQNNRPTLLIAYHDSLERLCNPATAETRCPIVFLFDEIMKTNFEAPKHITRRKF